MSGGEVVSGALVGLLVFVAVVVLLSVPRRDRLRRVLHPHLPAAAGTSETSPYDPPSKGFFDRLTERSLRRIGLYAPLDIRLLRAGWSMRPAQLTWICLGAGLSLALVTGLLGAPGVLVFFLLLLGGYLPVLFLSIKAGQRARTFETQLPDVLNGWTSLLQAGHSLRQAIESTARDGVAPASEEFSRLLRQVNIGLPLEDGLQDLGKRMDSRDVDFVVTATAIQREIGGSMANFLELVSDTVRDRQYLSRRIQALTAVGRFSAIVLLVMPFVLWALLTLFNPDYMRPLIHTTAGRVLLGIAVVLMTIGALTIRRIVNADRA
jgi:tight adherence protein B